jgi:predicted SAM-dependent methyltransferase
MMTDVCLNLGCGAKCLAGYINVDKFGDPDFNFDLETFPYPWDDNSVREIELHHVLEHLGQQTETYLKIIQEFYRICQPGAKIHITVPHHRSDRFFHDPTHVRPITAIGLSMFSKQKNREWQATGKAFTFNQISS